MQRIIIFLYFKECWTLAAFRGFASLESTLRSFLKLTDFWISGCKEDFAPHRTIIQIESNNFHVWALAFLCSFLLKIEKYSEHSSCSLVLWGLVEKEKCYFFFLFWGVSWIDLKFGFRFVLCLIYVLKSVNTYIAFVLYILWNFLLVTYTYILIYMHVHR